MHLCIHLVANWQLFMWDCASFLEGDTLVYNFVIHSLEGYRAYVTLNKYPTTENFFSIMLCILKRIKPLRL